MSLIASHAAESGHWYGRNGEPAYTIVGANGKARPTTLRDALNEANDWSQQKDPWTA